MRLDLYQKGDYQPGAPLWKQLLWFYWGQPMLQSRLMPFSALKVLLLRAFGAQVGQQVRIKPGLKVKFPWRLRIGDQVWLGEEAWIDNLAPVAIGNHCCISQGVYLCTGNHDWSRPDFHLRLGEIQIEEGCWIAAQAVVGPGVLVQRGAILCLGAVALTSLQAETIYAGNPAQAVKSRPSFLSSLPADNRESSEINREPELVGI
jgi:putative colanic acid biosynthesis acetyltransferase WcaF